MTTILNRDEKRGHFHLQLDEGREVTGCDLGPALHLWTQGAHLTPSAARLLADALTWWANRREARDRESPTGPPPPPTAQLDLFGELVPEPESTDV